MDLAALRRFILKHYNDDELEDLTFDYFPDVNRRFTSGMTMPQKVRELITFADRYGRMDHLLAALEATRQEAYCEQFGSSEEVLPPLPPNERNPGQIFISYANADFDAAHRLAGDLHAEGFPIWMAPESIRPGEKWMDAINRGLACSGIFLLVLTPDAVASRWVYDETSVAIALENKKQARFYTLSFAPADVPPLWSIRQHISFQDDYDRGLRALIKELRPEMSPVKTGAAAVAAGSAAKAATRTPPAESAPTSPPPAAQPGKQSKTPAWLLGVGALALIAVVAGVIFALSSGRDGDSNRAAAALTTPQPPTALAVIAVAETPATAEAATPTVRAATATAAQPAATSTPTDTPAPEDTSPAAAPTEEATKAASAVPPATASPTAAAAALPVNLVIGGSRPLDFETFSEWTAEDETKGALTQTQAQVHGGEHAAALRYNFFSARDERLVLEQEIPIAGRPNALSMWVYGDGSGHFLNAWILDANGQTWQAPFGQVWHEGWKQMTALLIPGQEWPWMHVTGSNNGVVDYPIRLRALMLDDVSADYTGQGTVYLDDLSATTASDDLIAAVISPTPAPTATAGTGTGTPESAGAAGSIFFIVTDTVYTTDPDWSGPSAVGKSADNSCSSPMTLADGTSYQVYAGSYCGIGGAGVCASPNGAYEVMIGATADGHSLAVRPAGTEDLRFVYQGPVDQSEGVRWSPQNDAFLFAVGDTIYRASSEGGYSQLIETAYSPIFSPDGRRVLYAGPSGGGGIDLFVLAADGSGLSQNVSNMGAPAIVCHRWARP